jgi:hypothetical protein
MPRANPYPNPKDLMAKVITGFHRTVYDLSGGRIGGDLLQMPVLKLTTVGRKSGERRTTMLTAAHEMGESVVIVASYGGDDRHPAWYLNLEADPDVERLWSEIIRKHPNYAGYQRSTKREIPVVVLDPA